MTSERARKRKNALAVLAAEPAAQYEVVHGFAAQVFKTALLIDKQGQRIGQESFEQAQLDTDLLVSSLRALVTTASTLGDLGVEVAPHVTKFDGAFPEAKAVRDVLAHPEDYLLGAGDLQTQPGVPMEMFYSRGAGGTAIHMSNPEVLLDVGSLIPAAMELANDVLEATHDWLDEHAADGEMY